MNKLSPYLFAVITGFISVASWISPIPAFMLLFSYIPLLFGEYWIINNMKQKKLNVFFMAFICFIVVNITGLWWLYKLVSYWAVLLNVFNAVFASAVFLLFSTVKEKTGTTIGYISFIVFTVAYEYLMLNIDFSFPCFLNGNLIFGSGNVFLVQWYEYTGILGGSVWVLLCNVLFFLLIKNIIEKRRIRNYVKLLITCAACLFLPIIFSIYLYKSYEEEEIPMEVVIVQPNFDPYTEKFTISYDQQLDTMISLAKAQITQSTEYIIFPETALDGNIWKNNIDENYLMLKIKDSLLYNSYTSVITGIDMMEYYVVHDGITPTKTAKKADEKIYYDFFNAAIQVNNQQDIQVYKKSKLVLGTEYVPFTQKFPRIQNWIVNLGGSAQSRGKADKPNIFYSPKSSVSTIICYESLFGKYVSEGIKLGAEAVFVITNDGWWNNTPAPAQHFKFSQLRAIETRRSIARCANTGISGFVNQRGDVIEKTAWWERTGLRNTINKNSKLTFYSKYGDFIGILCLTISILVLLIYFYRLKKKL